MAAERGKAMTSQIAGELRVSEDRILPIRWIDRDAAGVRPEAAVVFNGGEAKRGWPGG